MDGFGQLDAFEKPIYGIPENLKPRLPLCGRTDRNNPPKEHLPRQSYPFVVPEDGWPHAETPSQE
jgi:hypothetical protein